MKILNFGSLNIDHVYSVDHFVRPGETLDSLKHETFAGGKGNNQSIALARAGAEAYHAGRIGADGLWLKKRLADCGVNTSFIEECEDPTGHAVIQVDKSGENAIVLHGGANRKISRAFAETVIAQFSPGDFLLLQNEISSIPAIMEIGAGLGLRIFFNPAPITSAVPDYPLDLVHCFILNQIEGAGLSGEQQPDKMLSSMTRRFPAASTVITLGEKGAVYGNGNTRLTVPAQKVTVTDTTAAGDTFAGYLVAGIARGDSIETALETACRAASICVTRRGASDSIPTREEIG